MRAGHMMGSLPGPRQPSRASSYNWEISQKGSSAPTATLNRWGYSMEVEQGKQMGELPLLTMIQDRLQPPSPCGTYVALQRLLSTL